MPTSVHRLKSDDWRPRSARITTCVVLFWSSQLRDSAPYISTMFRFRLQGWPSCMWVA